MGSPHYTPTGKPRADVTGFSQDMRQEFELIETGIETMQRLPLTWSSENAHAGGNHNEYFPIPFKCTIKEMYVVNSLVNGANSVACFMYVEFGGGGGGLIGNIAWNYFANDPAETILKTANVIQTFADVDIGDKLRLNIQGDGVSTMPISMTFIVHPRI